MSPPKISAAIITYNEEKNIRDCLESIKWVDEIVVVDSLSTDKTVEICKLYTNTIFQRPWPGHVAQKQFALEQATGEWIMSMDADERLAPGAPAEIARELAQVPPDIDGYIFPRHSYYLGRWINHGGWYPDYKLRLIRNGRGRWGGVDPHDKLMVNGPTRTLQSEILHYVYHTLSHQLKTVDSFSDIIARQWQQQGKSFNLLSLVLRPPLKFLECYILKRGFLDGLPGFIIAVNSSFYVFMKYAKLWQQHYKKRAD